MFALKLLQHFKYNQYLKFTMAYHYLNNSYVNQNNQQYNNSKILNHGVHDLFLFLNDKDNYVYTIDCFYHNQASTNTYLKHAFHINN
jgi:hypothetical protein